MASWLKRATTGMIFGIGCVAALIASATGTVSSPGSTSLSVLLRPQAVDGMGRVPSVSVIIQEPVGIVAANKPLLRLPLIISNVLTSAMDLQDMQARDIDGSVTLTVHDDPSGSSAYRRWTASRLVHGPLKLSYRVPISDAPNARGAAPPFEVRTEAGAFSALSGAFIVMPDTEARLRLELRWDFSAAPKDSIGVSTLGVGNRSGEEVLPLHELESVFVMGGAVHHEPAQPAADGFFSAWQGSPPFDGHAVGQWTHKLYDFYSKFFNNQRSAYSVFLRRNPINPGGGVEVAHSFVGTFDVHTDPEDLKLTLAHEMVHTFVGQLDGQDELSESWYAEGLAVYYQRELPLRAGMITRDTFLKDLNDTAARYYTDILNTTPNNGIPARFWPDTRVRVLPYDRGALYFAEVDEAVRKASGGARSLDDLVLAMLRRRAAGQMLSQTDWVQLIEHELGVAGRAQFEAMLAGKLVLPSSEAFGSCFRRTQVPMRRYDLGFTPDVLIEPDRIVRGLTPGSAAERVGLRNGDRIVKPVPQDAIQGDQHALLHLIIRRDGKLLDISYLPRSETVDTYQWVRTNIPSCKAGG